MLTVNEVSKISGVSIRTLQYYDNIGLLKPVCHTKAGYRLYDESSLGLLQQIMLYKELEFSLSDIKKILQSKDFDKNLALAQQIELLTLKKEHLENLITFAKGLKGIGDKYMDFKAFDTKKIDEYAKSAKEQWGNTKEFKEFEEKAKGRTKEKEMEIADEFMNIFAEFGKIKDETPDSDKAYELVIKLKQYITDNFYNCSDEILLSLGQMYAGGGDFTTNIDKVGGTGTGEFTYLAIKNYYEKNNA